MRAKDAIHAWLTARIAEHLRIPQATIHPDADLIRLGLDSVGVVQLSGDLEAWLGVRLPPTLVYELPTINRLVEHLARPSAPASADGSLPRAPRAREAVAIVGMGVRFPGGAATPDAFWRLLVDGVSAIVPEPPERRLGSKADPAEPAFGGFLRRIDEFDAGFFGVSPREATYMDPQQRLVLEVGWEALENAGYAGGRALRAGVFLGMMDNHEYAKLQMQLRGPAYADELYYGTGISSNIAAGRLSTFIDATGPSITLDTACSSSLVAVHVACQALRAGDCDIAIVAGVNALVLGESFVTSARMGMSSRDGCCVPFASAPSGMVLGEGCGAIVLQRLTDAFDGGSTIYACILGTAVNHDGAAHGLLTPNSRAQQAVIRDALGDADRSPSEIGFVEAHGASTTLGDRSEIDALRATFDHGIREAPLVVGSVKGNVGHLVGAAGLAGLIKTTLSIFYAEIAPQPTSGFRAPQPALENGSIRLAAGGPWPAPLRRRTAGVSSFGWGGTNAHVVVEEAPERRESSKGRAVQLLVLSARTESALEEGRKRLARHLREKVVELSDVAYTLQVGRRGWEHRVAVVCRTSEEAIAGLESCGANTIRGRSAAGQDGLEVHVDVERLSVHYGSRSDGDPEGGERDLEALLMRVARLWVSGARVEWSELHAGERRTRVPLPTYAFERQRYWIDTASSGPAAGLMAQEPEKKADLADWFWVPSWKRSYVRETSESGAGVWLLVGDAGGLAERLAARLRQRGARVVTVERGVGFAELGPERYAVRPGEREDYRCVLEALSARHVTVGSIAHLWLAEPVAAWRARGEEAVTGALERGFCSLMALAQALGEHSANSQRVVIVSSELQDVSSSELLCAEKALAMGPCLVVPQEYRHIRCRNVDVEAREVERPTEAFVARLETELVGDQDETVVALRGADRWVQEVAAVRLPASTGRRRLREGGAYLITGGLGGIGLAMAEYLHRTVRARLVLVGRTAGRNGDRLEALRRAGAEVLVRTADVAERVELAAVVEQAEAAFGPLHGVIHAAGVAPSGLIQRKTREMAEAVMRPKVQGVLALADVFRGRTLDFLCLFSSMSSMTGGGPGQIDYCGANAFLDAYARQHFTEHGMTFAIAWGEWQWNAWQDGLAGFPEEARRYFIDKRKAFGLSFDEGAEAFARILDHRIPSTFVATQDFAQMVEGSKNFSVTTILQAVKRMRGTRPNHPRPSLAVSYVAPVTDIERLLAGIWCDLLGFSEVGVDDNFFDLGGNSLLGVDLIARIGSDLGIPAVPAHLLYQAPTIASLADALGLSDTKQVVTEDWSARNEKRREKLRRMRRDA